MSYPIHPVVSHLLSAIFFLYLYPVRAHPHPVLLFSEYLQKGVDCRVQGYNFLWHLSLCFLNPFKILAKVFSRGALESYLPRLQDVIKSEIAKWCSEPGTVEVYSAARSLTFRIAVRVLLGLQMEEERIVYLAQIFEQLMNNLFSLPIDAPLSGLRKVSEHEVTSDRLLITNHLICVFFEIQKQKSRMEEKHCLWPFFCCW